jgi:5-methyltetrahydrofolate--homocysteine methyltransferase
MLFHDNWPQAQKDMTAWWEGTLNRAALCVTSPRKDIPFPFSYTGWDFLHFQANPRKAIERFEDYCRATCFAGEAMPSLWLNLGPGVLAAFFTGYLKFDGEACTAWFEQPADWDKVEKYRMSEDNDWWKYTRRITRLATDAAKDKYLVGMTDIGGVLDVVASFRGTQELLFDLIQEPQRVLDTCARVSQAWDHVYDTLHSIISRGQEGTCAWMGIWCPERWYPLQCDFSAMISPGMFEKFVLPDLQHQAKKMDYSIYHLDGPGQLPHVDMILDVPEIHGIQWVPGSGEPQNESYKWDSLYEKILSKGKRLVLQCFNDHRHILETLERLPTRKGVLVSACFPDEDEARRFIDQARALGE